MPFNSRILLNHRKTLSLCAYTHYNTYARYHATTIRIADDLTLSVHLVYAC
jgi:hypothetical protein